MADRSVRTTIDIPIPTYRKLKEQAARQGCSVRELVMNGIERVILTPRHATSKRVRFPLTGSDGPKVDLANESVYELIEFP